MIDVKWLRLLMLKVVRISCFLPLFFGKVLVIGAEETLPFQPAHHLHVVPYSMPSEGPITIEVAAHEDWELGLEPLRVFSYRLKNLTNIAQLSLTYLTRPNSEKQEAGRPMYFNGSNPSFSR